MKYSYCLITELPKVLFHRENSAFSNESNFIQAKTCSYNITVSTYFTMYLFYHSTQNGILIRSK